MTSEPDGSTVYVIAIVKGKERYVFFYEDDQREDLLQVLGRFASNHDLSFTWYDATTLAKRVREQAPGAGRFRNKAM